MDTYNILGVDSEASNLKALERTLRREYNVFSATSSERALFMMEQNEISMVIADQSMFGMTDGEPLEKALKKYPDTVCIILTENANEESSVDSISAERIYNYITKPWEPEEMRNVVRKGIQTYETSRLQKANRRKRIGEILVNSGIISQRQLEVALEMQMRDRRKLGEILVELGYTDEESIFYCYGLQLGMPYVSLSGFPIQSDAAKIMPSELAYKHTVVPIYTLGKVLVVATSEPLSSRAKSEIEEATQYKVMAVGVSHRDMEEALSGRMLYDSTETEELQPEHIAK
jgi:CheY-like chemotaxis protein